VRIYSNLTAFVEARSAETMRPVVWKYVILICFPSIDIGFKLIPNLGNVRKRRFYENLSGSHQMHTGPTIVVTRYIDQVRTQKRSLCEWLGVLKNLVKLTKLNYKCPKLCCL